jgi:foldase protein PrsA
MDNIKQDRKSRNTKIYITVLGAIFVLMVIIFTIGFSKEEAVAKVGSETISKEELYDYLVDNYGVASVDTLITNKIVELEAEKEKIKVTDEEKEKELQALMESYGGEETFNLTLEQSGMTKEDVTKEINHIITIKKLLEPRINITEEEIKTYFDENKETFDTKEQVKASHILVADEATAKEVKKKISAGADFAELAKEYSTDTATSEKGGDLGYFERGTMATEFDEMAFTLEKNVISDPVKTDYGYHIIKVEDKKAAAPAVYEDHVEEIKDTLYDEKVETEYTTWLDEKNSDYDIENLLSDA